MGVGVCFFLGIWNASPPHTGTPRPSPHICVYIHIYLKGRGALHLSCRVNIAYSSPTARRAHGGAKGGLSLLQVRIQRRQEIHVRQALGMRVVGRRFARRGGWGFGWKMRAGVDTRSFRERDVGVRTAWGVVLLGSLAAADFHDGYGVRGAGLPCGSGCFWAWIRMLRGHRLRGNFRWCWLRMVALSCLPLLRIRGPLEEILD